jgi:hypothetical protein
MIILPYITIKYDFYIGKLGGGYSCILHRCHVVEGCNNTAGTSCFKKKYSVSSRAYEAVRESWPLKMRPIGCPETSVRNYHNTLRNNLEERSSLLIY